MPHNQMYFLLFFPPYLFSKDLLYSIEWYYENPISCTYVGCVAILAKGNSHYLMNFQCDLSFIILININIYRADFEFHFQCKIKYDFMEMMAVAKSIYRLIFLPVRVILDCVTECGSTLAQVAEHVPGRAPAPLVGDTACRVLPTQLGCPDAHRVIYKPISARSIRGMWRFAHIFHCTCSEKNILCFFKEKL